MEEKEEVLEQPEKESKNKGEKQIVLTAQVLNVCFAIVAMFLFVLCKILSHFGVGNNTFYGIMSIVIYGLSLSGLVWAYLRDKKPTFEFWLNVIVFGLAIWLF